MTRIEQRIATTPQGPTVGPESVPIGSAVDRLEAGATWAEVMAGSRLGMLDLVAAIAFDALGDASSPGPSLARSTPRRPALRPMLLESALPVPGDRGLKLALSAGLLQIQDFWDDSHAAAQVADDLGESAFSPYWHAIAHRREPDPGNASYWFRRVGRHPIMVPMAEAARPLLGSSGPWDPAAMTALCTRARPGSADERLARSLQRIEMLLLLDAVAAALDPATG